MQIWELFQGYERAHGRYDVRRVNEKGKNEGPAKTVMEPATSLLWDIHLSGNGPGIGIIPLRQDDTVYWACIDIDINNINHEELESKCLRFKMPLVICRSKSGGAHCFIFFKEPAEARPVMDMLSYWASVLGYGGSEIFPKQSSRYDENDIGNWLNMPYYNVDRTSRYCIHDGEDLSLIEFLHYAESMRVNFADLDKIQESLSTNAGVPLNEGMFEEGPPCLQRLLSLGGFPDGVRNEGMYNVGVYLRKKYPDNWPDKMPEYNSEMCDPPLSLNDVNTIVKSGQRKEYEYKCKHPPIAPYCDRRLCQSRKYGVGEGIDGKSRPEVLDVKKVIGDTVLWYMTVGGKRMLFMTEEILSQSLWKRKIAESINRVPRSMPQDRWDKWLDELISNCEIEYAPEDATPLGQFRIILESYLLGQARTTTKEQLVESNSPYVTGEGEIWFKLQGLMKFLNNQGYVFKSMNHLSEMLKSKEIGAVNNEMNIKGKTYNIWRIKEPGRPTDVNPEAKFGTTEF